MAKPCGGFFVGGARLGGIVKTPQFSINLVCSRVEYFILRFAAFSGIHIYKNLHGIVACLTVKCIRCPFERHDLVDKRPGFETAVEHAGECFGNIATAAICYKQILIRYGCLQEKELNYQLSRKPFRHF